MKNVSVKFLGCKALEVLPCSNGPIEGEIQIEPLKGVLGYINKAEKKVGVLLEPVKKHGLFTQFNCAGLIGTVWASATAKTARSTNRNRRVVTTGSSRRLPRSTR